MALDGALDPHVHADPLGQRGRGLSRRQPDSAALEERIGYRFANHDLLLRALTHVSGGGAENYQRLEFLGDRVLGLGVAELLYAAYPDATEGELSRRLSELVRRETCAEIALAWDVGPHLRLGAGESQAGGRRNAAILADVCEAILGAVFLDGGYDAVRSVVQRVFAERHAAPRRPLRDPKTAHQEWALGRGLPTPTYVLVDRTGPDHAPRFRVAARVEGIEVGLGSGLTKRAAEQEAAQTLLMREGVWTEAERG